MNRLSDEKRAAILRFLTEGMAVRATARLVGCAKATVFKLLVEAGEFCSIYWDHVLRALTPSRIESDEIWSFVGATRKDAKQERQDDIWTFTTIDPDSKLVVTWLVGERSQDSATSFMCDLASRVTDKIQLSTDGHGMYPNAVRAAFAWNEVDYAQIGKSFGQTGSRDRQRRYSPATRMGVKRVRVIGRPNPDLSSTSIVERSNLMLRTRARRFTRLATAYSRKIENHAHAASLAFMAHNFCTANSTLTKAHGGIKCAPAMEAGVTDRLWKIEDIVARMSPDFPLLSR